MRNDLLKNFGSCDDVIGFGEASKAGLARPISSVVDSSSKMLNFRVVNTLEGVLSFESPPLSDSDVTFFKKSDLFFDNFRFKCRRFSFSLLYATSGNQNVKKCLGTTFSRELSEQLSME